MKNHLFLLRPFPTPVPISFTFERDFEGSWGLLLRPFGLPKNVKDMGTGGGKGLTKRGKENEEKSKNQMRQFRSHLPISITKTDENMSLKQTCRRNARGMHDSLNSTKSKSIQTRSDPSGGGGFNRLAQSAGPCW